MFDLLASWPRQQDDRGEELIGLYAAGRRCCELGSSGDDRPAVSVLEQNLADCERVLGPDDPATVLARVNLIGARRAAGDPDRDVHTWQDRTSTG